MQSSYLRLDLGGSVRATSLMLRKKCAHVSTLNLVLPNRRFQRPMADAGVVTTFEDIGDLPNLSRLEVRSYPNSGVSLPASALTALLQRSKGLYFLLLSGLEIKGTESEVQAAAKALQEHPTIGHIFIARCTATEGSTPLTPLLDAVARNTHVECLILDSVTWAHDHGSLNTLCGPESSLQSLRFMGKNMIRLEDLTSMADTLQANVKLREFRITECPLPPGSGALLAQVLAGSTSLEDVILEFLSPRDLIPICKALCANTTLKRFELFLHKPGNDVQRNFLTNLYTFMLQHNTTLRQFVLHSPVAVMTNDVLEYFLRLNRAGRGRLLHQGSSLSDYEWVDDLAANSLDLTVLYYILSMKPSLCQVCPNRNETTAASTTTNSSSRRRKHPPSKTTRKRRRSSCTAVQDKSTSAILTKVARQTSV